MAFFNCFHCSLEGLLDGLESFQLVLITIIALAEKLLKMHI